ncbi:Transmembrane protein 62 [Mortierella claussenii]|nr:Transmembrane protein 62 [Mortierella claussenii]
MSRSTVTAVGTAAASPQRRSWIKTAVAFIPFLALVTSAWLYAIHLHSLANLSMVRSKEHFGADDSRSDSLSDLSSPPGTDQDKVVIGDSKDNIFYFVQVSDLHISTFRKASTANFYTFLSTALPLIEPAFVVVTGDLTDAKDKQLVGSMQYMDEWNTYRDALEESGVLNKRNGTFWHDLRGNHDCFNVPGWDSQHNKFAAMSSTRAPGFMFDVKTDYGKYGFIGIDACPKLGPARPYNFFGLFETPDMDNLRERLSLSQGNNHTFVFSHYPVTTTMFGETSAGETFAELSKSFSVYMCGHLHKLKWGLGEALQAYQPTHFLELEVGDMKQNGLYRIMVVDNDMISFTDVSLSMTTIPSALMPSLKENQDTEQEDSASETQEQTANGKDRKRPTLGSRLPTNPIIVVSNPKDSRYLIPKHEPVGRIGTSTHIRFLAWTDNQVPDGDHEYVRKDIKVEIRIDGVIHDKPARFAGTKAEDQTVDEEYLPLYVSEWSPQTFNDRQDHELEIKIVDRFGRVGSSKTMFRVDGERSKMKGGFAEWVMGANIALLLKTLFTTGYLAVTLILLILPKLYSLYLQTSPPPSTALLSKAVAVDMASLSPPPLSPQQQHSDRPLFRNGYDAWLDQKRRHLYRLSSTLSSASSRHRFWNRFVNHTIHAHILRFVHFSTQPILFYTTLAFTLMLVTVPRFWGQFVPAAGEQGEGYFYLQGIYLPHAVGGHLGGGLRMAGSSGHAAAVGGVGGGGANAIEQPLRMLGGVISSVTGGRVLSKYAAPVGVSFEHNADRSLGAGTWMPMADTWMSSIWTVIYDLVIFLYYLTLCATPSGYLYSPSNPHRLRPYHRTWYVRCLIFGIWVFRCCSVLMTAELYGPSVIWTGIGTYWLVVVGWLMFMVGWSRSRVERDVLLRKGEDDNDRDDDGGVVRLARELKEVEEVEEGGRLLDTVEKISLLSEKKSHLFAGLHVGEEEEHGQNKRQQRTRRTNH